MIKKIIHIADLHIKTFKEHELYKKQFNIFIQDLVKKLDGYSREEIRIVIAGDVAHQKINISNEQLMLTSWLFTELSKIGKVVIIPGNHDFLENNPDRLDTITPVVELLNNSNISYYKNSGLYKDDNINWVVYSLYQNNTKPKYEKDPSKLHIGLFHSPIIGLATDTGYEFNDEHNAFDPVIFSDLDLLLCGDIHKRQVLSLSNGRPAIMIGSLIQQNFGETINNHGYGIYDVKNDSYEFVNIHNDEPFLCFEINDINDILDGKETLVNFE